MKTTIGRDTKLCISLAGRPGIFGSRFHNHLYESLGLDYVYKAFTTRDLPAAIAGIRALGIRGCGISMPFKEAVIPMIDRLDPSARSIASVNTIVNEDGRLIGYNTDYSAVRSLITCAGISPATAFILRGSGGMAKAVAAALYDNGFRHGTILARNVIAGPALANSYGFRWQQALNDLSAPLLINASPLGMAGPDEAACAFPIDRIAACDVVFDVVALPIETPLLAAARRAGKTVITGGEVAVLQALQQFLLYTGIEPTQIQIEAAAAFARRAG